MKIVSSSRMAEIDRLAQKDFSLSGSILMENAGCMTVRTLVSKIWKGIVPEGLFVFLAGNGNNAGDAMVMARRFFVEGKTDCCIITACGVMKPGSDTEKNHAICQKLGIPVIDYQKERTGAEAALRECSVVFDGLFGTGLSRPLSGGTETLVAFVNALDCTRIAIDIPSGIFDGYKETDTAFHADLTCTMELPKQCLYLPSARPLCGEILPVNPGFPPPLIEAADIPGNLLTDRDIFSFVPDIPLNAYKKTRGHAAVFAGSPGTSGAAILSATSAARAGSGLVTLFTDAEAYTAVAPQCRSIMVAVRDAGSIDTVLGDHTYTALCAGPGMGTSHETSLLVEALIDAPIPAVIDADGLTLLAAIMKTKPVDFSGSAILTPHPGECARIAGCTIPELLADPVGILQSFAARIGAVIVLKSFTTYIIEPGGTYWIYDFMNPGLGTGGTGDVLSGIITGLLAQGADPLDAACAGVLIHGKAGMLAFEEHGWLLAEDLLPYISRLSCFSGRNENWE